MPPRAHAREPDTDPVFLSLLLFLFKGVWGIFLFLYGGGGDYDRFVRQVA